MFFFLIFIGFYLTHNHTDYIENTKEHKLNKTTCATSSASLPESSLYKFICVAPFLKKEIQSALCNTVYIKRHSGKI